MNKHLRDFAKKRFEVDLEALPEPEQRVIHHYGERRHISRDTNREFEKKLTEGLVSSHHRISEKSLALQVPACSPVYPSTEKTARQPRSTQIPPPFRSVPQVSCSRHGASLSCRLRRTSPRLPVGQYSDLPFRDSHVMVCRCAGW